MDINQTLADRGKTHGDFHEQAEFTGVLSELLRSRDNWRRLTYGQKHALEMIAVKIGRILIGNPHHADSWHDIAGYATLAERECTEYPVGHTSTTLQ